MLLSEITVVQPDLLFVSRERLAIVEPWYVRGTPDLVIEVIFPSTAQTDRHAKRQLYARYGVPHYWIFDPEQREAVGLVLRGGTYWTAKLSPFLPTSGAIQPLQAVSAGGSGNCASQSVEAVPRIR